MLLAYWRRQLAGAAPLALVGDRPRPAMPTFECAEQPLALSRELSDALAALSTRAGATLFMTLLAALDILLHWYTGQTDIVVGTDIANRTQAETEGLIGFFVNMLALRADLAGNPSFRELLGRVREICLEAYAHQDLPFELLVNELQPERSLDRTPLFQVVLVLQNAPSAAPDLDGLAMELLPADPGTAKFDLVIGLAETATGIAGTFKYNTDLFDAAMIARMVEHFVAVLDHVMQRPDEPLNILVDALAAANRRQQIDQARDLKAAQQRAFKHVRRKAITG